MNIQKLEIIRSAVKAQGLSAVARVLDVNRETLSSVLAGSARKVSVAAIEGRADRLVADTTPPERLERVTTTIVNHPAALRLVDELLQSHGYYAPFNLVDLARAAIAQHGEAKCSEDTGLSVEVLRLVAAAEAPIHVLALVRTKVPELRALTRVEATPKAAP